MRYLALLVLMFWGLAAHAQTVAITNARLMDGQRDEADITIVLRQGAIESVTSGGVPPAGARIVDAGGRPVTGSLAAAATQIGVAGMGGAADTQDGTVSSGATGASFSLAPAIDPNALTIQEARAGGVAKAMVFPSGGEGVFSGTGAMLRLLPSAEIVTQPAAAMFATVSGKNAGGSRGAGWTLIRNALTEAKAFVGSANAPRDDLLNPLDLAALRPVVAGTMPLAISVNRESDIRQAAALAKEYAIRVVILGGAEAWRAADLLAAHRIPVILDPLDELPFTYDMVGARRDNAAILAKAGVPIAFMVSAQGIYLSYNVGTGLREGAGIAAANGLPRGAALKAITTGPMQVWTGKEAAGIAAGAPADLVIWDGDPLEPASAPLHVFLGGNEISLVTRQTLLRDRYHPQRSGDPLPPAYR